MAMSRLLAARRSKSTSLTLADGGANELGGVLGGVARMRKA